MQTSYAFSNETDSLLLTEHSTRAHDFQPVITRTPLRISFAGGGTDLPDFYELEPGAVFSTAINKYVYVTVKRHGELFNEPIRLNYSQTEQVEHISEINNDIARECLRFLQIEPPIYISTVADLPASTGLGGSSSFAVGLLHALHAYRGERVSAGQLAEEASQIEIQVLRQPIGKQDQYAAAFGGLNLFRFNPGGWVSVEPQRLSSARLRHLFRNILLFWTGIRRDAQSVLQEQKTNTGRKLIELREMRNQALLMQRLVECGQLEPETLGRLVHQGWQWKRALAGTISSSQIDDWYQKAMDAGAEGGKICGAGGGGFLLFFVRPECKEAVCHALRDLLLVPVQAEVHGSRVLLCGAI